MDPVLWLPVELSIEIFSYLGPIDLVLSSMVSKAWRLLANSDHFWRGHLPESERLAPPPKRQKSIRAKEQDLVPLLEPPCNDQKHLYARRASSLAKWRRNQWWSHDTPDRKASVTAIGNGAIVAEATPTHLTVYNLNDGCYESLAAQRVPHTGQVVRMSAVAPDFLVVNVSLVMMCYRWTGTELVLVDGVYAERAENPRELQLKSWNQRDPEEFLNVQIVELEAHALIHNNLIVFSRFLDYLPAYTWDVSKRCIVGTVSVVTGSHEVPFSIYGDSIGRIYVCYDGLITIHETTGLEVRRLITEVEYDVGDVQLQFNDRPTVMATVVNADETGATIVAWDPSGNFRRVGAALEFEAAALRALHPSWRALLFERRLVNESEDAPDLCSIVAIDLATHDILWESHDLMECPFWDDPFYLVEDKFLVLQARTDSATPALRLVDVTDGTLSTNTLGNDLESIVHFGGKFVYCKTNQGWYRYIVFT